MLEDINHHIALTSDENNHYKFRVIVELDAPVSLDNLTWRYFIESIGSYLSLQVDLLARSAVCFGYKGRKILTTMGQSRIEIKDHILIATEKAQNKEAQAKEYTPKEKKDMVNNSFVTFEFAFNAIAGDRHRTMMATIYKAMSLGMTDQQIYDLLDEINNYMEEPLSSKRLKVVKSAVPKYRIKLS